MISYRNSSKVSLKSKFKCFDYKAAWLIFESSTSIQKSSMHFFFFFPLFSVMVATKIIGKHQLVFFSLAHTETHRYSHTHTNHQSHNHINQNKSLCYAYWESKLELSPSPHFFNFLLGAVSDMHKIPQLFKCIHGLWIESPSKLQKWAAI